MIKYVILGLVVIIVLSYFGYDIKSIVEAPVTQNNLNYTWSGVTYVWDYVKTPLTYLWEKIFIGLLWNAFVHNLERLDRGAPTDLENAGRRLINIGEQGYVPVGR